MKIRTVVVLVVVALAGAATAVQAAVVTSADFSMGYGAYLGLPIWTTDETAAVNTPTTQGNFTFAPAPTGKRGGGFGPKFVNRILSTGVDGDNQCAVSFGTEHFTVPIVASYNGPAPIDVDPINPGYKLEIEITNISVWAAAYLGYSTSAKWDETTSGHTASSPAITLIETNEGYNVEKYRQLAWDPDDYETSLGSLNSSFTRMFKIIPVVSGSDFRMVDGVEVMGRVHLVYNLIPEPMTVAFLAVGGFLAMLRPRRSRV